MGLDMFNESMLEGFDRGTAVERAMEKYALSEIASNMALIYPKHSYFRDAYNPSNLFHQLGIDRRAKGVVGRIPPEGVKRLLAMVEATEVPEPLRPPMEPPEELETLAEQQGGKLATCSIPDLDYFVEKRERLLTFLRIAAHRGSVIEVDG